jgi:hypothetical protein
LKKKEKLRPPPRPPTVLADLQMIAKRVEQLAEDYVRAHDFGYITGGGRPEGGGKPVGVDRSDPTGDAAIDDSKENARVYAYRASERIKDALGDVNAALTLLQYAYPKQKGGVASGNTDEFPRVVSPEEQARANERLAYEPDADGWRRI